MSAELPDQPGRVLSDGKRYTLCPDKDCTGTIRDDGSCTSGHCQSGRLYSRSRATWRRLRLRWITRGGRYPWCNRDGECVLRPGHDGDCDWGE